MDVAQGQTAHVSPRVESPLLKAGWERRWANGGDLGKSEAATRHTPRTPGPPKEESITEGSSRYYSAANILILGFWIQEIDDEVFFLKPLACGHLSQSSQETHRQNSF